ncbi:hypothetical protein BKA70DRAFT_680006 [Coprinopsis sp. MPI-PUGE-AT-0042]|nr:hypothetical protein BKA70DRAFT_680006 [Coprinopsis sp. MPI-PUGE-AT-0042]
MPRHKVHPGYTPTRVAYGYVPNSNSRSLPPRPPPPSHAPLYPPPDQSLSAFSNHAVIENAARSPWQTTTNKKRVRWIENVDVRVFQPFDEELYFDGSQSPAPIDPVQLPEASFRNGTLTWVRKGGRSYSKSSYSTMRSLPPTFSTETVHRPATDLVSSSDQGRHHVNPHRTYPKPCIRLPYPPSPHLNAIEIEEETMETHRQSPYPSPSHPSHTLSPLPSDVYQEFIEFGARNPTRNNGPDWSPMPHCLSVPSSPDPWSPTRSSRGTLEAPTPWCGHHWSQTGRWS